jgi:small subunit ribosomal protein S6e
VGVLAGSQLSKKGCDLGNINKLLGKPIHDPPFKNEASVMAKFKLNVSNADTKKVTVHELDGPKAQPLVGREIGEIVDGSLIGMDKVKLQVTGGSDKDGIPMRSDVHGGAKKYALLSSGVGFNPTTQGERRRKLVRGRMITDQTYQINMRVIKEDQVKPAKKGGA